MATEVDQVRLLISDVDEDNALFTDDQIGVFLDLEVGVKRAAAAALDTIASSEVLVSKKIRTMDRETDGPAVADALRKHATALRLQADAEDELTDSFFYITSFTPARVEGEERYYDGRL